MGLRSSGRCVTMMTEQSELVRITPLPAFLEELRRAIECDEIVPYFQPVVELRSQRLVGFEVLARWPTYSAGSIGPMQFIPRAEKGGLIGLLTERLLLQASRAARRWPSDIRLSVNISTIQLKDSLLPDRLRRAVEDGGIGMDRLTLEITESALLGDLTTAKQVIGSLKDMGCRLAIDDFGTGYSSLNHLRALPFDILKVDASFVGAMNSVREDRKIVAAVVGLGHSLGLTSVAEGVEEIAQADLLLCLGCHYGQGWLYGRAVPAEAAAAMTGTSSASAIGEFPSKRVAADVAFRLEARPVDRLAQLQALYDGAPVGLCFLDAELRYVSLNRRLAEINNLPVEAHIGRCVSDVIPHVSASILPKLQAALGGEGTEFEIEMEGRALLAHYYPARDEGGEVVGVSVAIIDITDRKLAEDALRESDDHYRHTVELNPQITWTADPTGMILDANSRWTQVTGLTREQTLGEGWIHALHPDDLERTLAVWMDSLHSGKPVDVEYRVHCVNGSWCWMRARAFPRKNQSGKIIRWYGALEDVDDRKRIEEALALSRG